jgi:hypothetical protein
VVTGRLEPPVRQLRVGDRLRGPAVVLADGCPHEQSEPLHVRVGVGDQDGGARQPAFRVEDVEGRQRLGQRPVPGRDLAGPLGQHPAQRPAGQHQQPRRTGDAGVDPGQQGEPGEPVSVGQRAAGSAAGQQG